MPKSAIDAKVLRIGKGRLADMLRKVGTLDGFQITAGIQAKEGAQPSDSGADVTVLDKAVWTEFGVRWSDRQRGPGPDAADSEWFIPPRPAFRTVWEARRATWVRLTSKMIVKYAKGEATAGRVGARVGSVMKADIQRSMVKGSWVPNAKSTKDAKGSSRPWVDTGQTRQSVRWRASLGGLTEGVG